MDEAAAKAISQTFLDTSYEVTQERVKEVRSALPLSGPAWMPLHTSAAALRKLRGDCDAATSAADIARLGFSG